jgi:hypothetical protein
VELILRDRAGGQWPVRQATITLNLPDHFKYEGAETTATLEAWPIRGWNYLDKPEDAGAVFWIGTEPSIVTAYRKTLPPLWGDQRPAAGAPSQQAPQPSGAAASAEDAQTRSSSGHPLMPGMAPFFPKPAGILEGLRSGLKDLAHNIAMKGGWRGYWARKKPIPEIAIDANIRPLLTDCVEKRAAHLAPQANSGLGVCDYLVSRGDDRVFVELKPGFGDWRQGIEAEITTHIETIQDKNASAGLFIVFAFGEGFGGAFAAGSPELKELLSLRDAVCKARNMRVDVAVISCFNQSPASHRKAAPRAEDALQYYAAHHDATPLTTIESHQTDSPVETIT